jgi:glycosyltransferase involved in cell wall biosynthesis
VAPNSDALRSLALAFMPEIAPRLRVVPNGIEEEAVAAAPACSGADELRWIQVGQLIGRKRVAATIESLAVLRGRGGRARLTIVGEGPLRRDLELLARERGVADEVEFLGHRPRTAVMELLRKHDVFIMTSAAEGMSNALLEAMACGLPIVTTRNGSHDLVEQAGCGRVTPVDEGDALTAALAELAASESLRDQLARAGLAHARTLTWTACARQFVDLLGQARSHNV